MPQENDTKQGGDSSALPDSPCSTCLFDKTGREIMVGDTIKIFHFIGARRKRHYMYKWVKSLEELGESKKPFFKMMHLNPREQSYWEPADGRKMEGIEIVQGYGKDDTMPFEDRPKLVS